MQEPDGETQLVTECWVEPQHGLVSGSPKQRQYLESLPYNRIADAVRKPEFFLQTRFLESFNRISNRSAKWMQSVSHLYSLTSNFI